MEKEKLNKSKKTATGSTRDEIEVRPKDKKLNEATKGKTAVLTFGRMNPPTIGHEVLVQTVLKTARASSGTPLIFLSHSSDPKKNPLSYDEKVRLAQAAFGRNIVVKSPARTIIEVLKTLTGSFDNVKVVVGSDRVSEFERILKTYNGRDFKFKSVEVVSAGTRDPDAEGVSGMSASKMRDLASSNDKNAFKKGLPKNLKSMSDMVLTMVRAGMKLAEELEAEGILYLDEAVLSVAQRRKKALAAKRYKSRLSFARKRQSKRMASTKRIAKRSARAAIRLMRRRLAGKKGLNYSNLSAGEKSAIDKRVQARKGVLKKLAKRLAPKVRRAEIARLRTRNESFDIYFDKYLQEMDASIQVNSLEEVYAIVDKFLDSIHSPLLTEKAESNIRKRSEKTGIDVNELFEAYYSGYKEPAADETPEEAGFKNMNDFIKNVVQEGGLWDNIHAKRKRIKAGSGEKMRKPGSEGAPTKQDFKDAKESVLSPTAGQSLDDKKKQKSLELETKGAPKGYHFTKDGKLKKGDADIDGKGGKMLRADPLDKQRSKIPPLPEQQTKAVDMRQKKELRNIQIRHARQDAAAKIKDLKSKVNEEFEQVDELYFKAKIGDLPPIFVDASSEGAVKRDLRKILKRPDEIIKSIERQTPASVRKHFRDMAKGTDLDTQDEIDEMFENFIDGKNPQDKGDSARHGIPKKATKAELEKIRSSDSASPRKKQLAHFQLNMRKGKK
jgi:protein-tyrosine-phosphatase